jgi:agmatine/peptidylarginine deiminase
VNRSSMILLLVGLLMTGVVIAETPDYNYPTDNEEPLPRWVTQQEMAIPGPYEIDTITPPPDNPVYLHGEFEPKQGILIRWPFYYEDMFAAMVDEAQDVGTVFILVSSVGNQNNCINSLANFGVDLENVEWLFVGTNAIWVRDYGPWFVDDMGEHSVVDMRYYPYRPQDDYVPEWLSSEWDYGYYGPNLYHEGGNQMNDGHGTIMMSTRVMDANPGMTQNQIEDVYHDYFGQENVHIFQRIAFDGTGHIDIWSKILNDHTILVAEFDQNDANYALVEGHVAVMDALPTHDGGTFDIVRIPMPTYQGGGYYKTHTNSILINNKAIIPTYGIASDAAAIAAYQAGLGPDWEVVGIDCNQIAPLGGELHCVAVEIPVAIQPLAAVQLHPVGEPIVIGWGGGNFQFSATVTNLQDAPFPCQAWTEVILPSGNLYGPVLDYNLNLAPLQVINTATMTQNVPGGIAGGEYTYVAKISDGQTVVAEDSFTFIKTGIGSSTDTQWTISGSFLADDETMRGGLPREFTLSEAYPNPFNPTTSLRLNLPERSDIQVNVFNVNGQRVANLYNGRMNAGQHTLTLDGSTLSSGVYFVHAAVSGQTSQIRKVTLLK